MAVPISAITADDHLDTHTWAKHPDLAGDSYFAFSQKIDYCLARDLSLIQAGDLFNRRFPDPASVYFFNQQMHRMKRGDIGVYAIQGNHEVFRTSPWLSSNASGCPAHVHKKAFQIGDIWFYGLDFQPAEQLKLELVALRQLEPKPHVLIAHQVWEEPMGLKAGPEAAYRDVPVVQMLITGDFHRHCVTRCVGVDEQPLTVLSPGSQCLQSKAEDPNKYFFILYSDLTVESVLLKSRPLERFKFRNPLSFEDELAQAVAKAVPGNELPEHIAKPIFVVEYSELISNVHARLKAALAGKVHLFETPIESRAAKAEVKPAIAKCGAVEQLELFKEDLPVYETSKRLLTAKDPLSEWQEIISDASKGS
jgi:hypothetical protein